VHPVLYPFERECRKHVKIRKLLLLENSVLQRLLPSHVKLAIQLTTFMTQKPKFYDPIILMQVDRMSNPNLHF